MQLHEGQWDWYSFVLKGHKQDRFRECVLRCVVPSLGSPPLTTCPRLCPTTVALLENIPNFMSDGIPFAFAFFSVMPGGTCTLWVGSDSPHGARARSHTCLFQPSLRTQRHAICGSVATSRCSVCAGLLCLLCEVSRPATHCCVRWVVPPKCHITVAGETRTWEEGEPLLFDDSFEHEVLSLDVGHAWWPVVTGVPSMLCVAVRGCALVMRVQVAHEGEGDRVVLLFDMWHPDLTPGEIREVCAMFDHARDQGWMK